MEGGSWQVQVSRDGRQVATFILPALLGLTRPESARIAARDILGDGVVRGTLMRHDLVVFDFDTLAQLNGFPAAVRP